MTSPGCVNCPMIAVYRPNLELSTTPRHQILPIPCDGLGAIAPHPLTIIFAQADTIRECANCKRFISDKFGIPPPWWTPWVRRSNGYYGCDEQADENNRLKAYNTWFRFLVKPTNTDVIAGHINYHWLKWNVFTHWISATNETFLIAFDAKEPVREGLLSMPLPANNDPGFFKDPYWIHALVLEQVAARQDVAVWGICELVRAREKNRPDIDAPNPDYQRDHDIARHAIHVAETADLSVKTVDHMISMHTEFALRHLPPPQTGEVHPHQQIDKHLCFMEHTMQGLKARSSSNRERLLNEIQLAFNVVSQYDSKTSVAIGRATQYDSYSMRTIAFLTLALLPATFISALFSMSFFNFDADNGWLVSGKIWIYFAIAGPVTMVTMSVWSFWQKLLPPDLVTDVELRKRGLHGTRGYHSGREDAGPKIEHLANSFPV
ncbi:hypothetical protein V8F06_014637 [Rhypophila decipiens]